MPEAVERDHRNGLNGRAHSPRRWWPKRTLGLALVGVTACSTVDPGYGSPAAPAAAHDCPRLSLSDIAAPVEGHGSRELDRLRRHCNSSAGALREAYILSAVGNDTAAMKILNRLLYGGESYGPSAEAFARYLRSNVFERRGESDRATHERQLAAKLAIDRDLRAELKTRFESSVSPTVEKPARAALAIRPRSSWNARRARTRSMDPMSKVARVTIHHSANPTFGTGTGTAIAAISAIQRYHMEQNGWGDIGYHFLIDPAGRIWTGRSLQWQGAHAGDRGKNRHNVGVCLLGNFVPGVQGKPPDVQLRSLQTIVAALCERYRVAPENILTHRELKPTSCPGPYLQAATEQIRQDLRGFAAPASSR